MPPLIESLIGEKIPESYDTLVTVIVMLIAIYGIAKAWDVLFPGRSKDAIDETKGTLLEKASRILDIAKERLHEALLVLFSGRGQRGIVTASQKVFAPTRGQASASIRSASGDPLVPEQAVRQAQAVSGIPYAGEDEEEPVPPAPEFHRNVRIILHAMDKDSSRRGWAGHIPSISDDRVRMHLEKSVNPENIFGRNEIVGDILLSYELDEDQKPRPKEFLLIQAYL